MCQTGLHLFDPLIVLIDRGLMLPKNTPMALGLLMHPSLTFGPILVVLSLHIAELKLRLGQSALVACSATEQSAHETGLGGQIVLPSRRRSPISPQPQVQRKRLIATQLPP